MKLNFTYTDELYHFGVKGMKWGVRHGRQSSGQPRHTGNGKRRKLTKEQKDRLKKAGVIALQTAGALYVGNQLRKNLANYKKYDDFRNYAYKRTAEHDVGRALKFDKFARRLNVGQAALGTAAVVGGVTALHNSEKLRKASMREKDEAKAKKLRRTSRGLEVAGTVINPAAGVPYAVTRAIKKEHIRANQKKYKRNYGYLRN